MHFALRTLFLGLLLSPPALCAEGAGEMPQLQQLNRASQQELRSIQEPADQAETVEPLDQNPRAEQLNRMQNREQQVLQESQRREVLMQKQRAKVAPATGRPHRLQAIDRQTRFRLQQQNQLNRFRIQQGIQNR
jgi:hypothetical protein